MHQDWRSGETTRREILARMGAGLVAITVNSACGGMSPAEARERGMALARLSDSEGRVLEALGEVLLPGAAEAGIAHYVDDQLASDRPLLMLKYLDYPGEWLAFYQQGLAALDQVSQARHGRSFAEISGEQRTAIVAEAAQKNPAEWSGPPAPLFYFALRSDAVDVVYGTKEGFERLKVPYMAHIEPAEKW